MYISFSNVFFFMGMSLGIIVSVMSNSWYGVWMGMELNLLCFIPILTKGVQEHGEGGVYYFLIQACGSLILLICGLNMCSYSLNLKIWIMVALFLKMGVAPFHFWYPYIAEQISWGTLYLLMTFQKITPLVMLALVDIDKFSSLIYMCAGASGLIGWWGGMYEISIRKLLAYSSITHLGWILIPMINGSKGWLPYFFIYSGILCFVVYLVETFEVYYLSQIEHAGLSWNGKFALLLSMCSLGGLPPLLGFIPKWVVIEGSVSEMDFMSLAVLILSSVGTLYYYLRVGLSASMVESTGKISNVSHSNTNIFGWCLLWNMMGFFISSLLMDSFLQ